MDTYLDDRYLKKIVIGQMIRYGMCYTTSGYDNHHDLGYAIKKIVNVHNALKRHQMFIIAKFFFDEEDDIEA